MKQGRGEQTMNELEQSYLTPKELSNYEMNRIAMIDELSDRIQDIEIAMIDCTDDEAYSLEIELDELTSELLCLGA